MEIASRSIRRVRWHPAPDLNIVFGGTRFAQNGAEAGGGATPLPVAAE